MPHTERNTEEAGEQLLHGAEQGTALKSPNEIQVSHRGTEIVTRSAAPPATIAVPSPSAPQLRAGHERLRLNHGSAQPFFI